jgi:hypothetical protein
MSGYREEAEAAQERIRTLEAELEERDAVLAAHEGTIAARDAELDELMRGRGRGLAPRRSATPIVVALITSTVAVVVGVELWRTNLGRKAAQGELEVARAALTADRERAHGHVLAQEARLRELDARLAECQTPPAAASAPLPPPRGEGPALDIDVVRQSLTVAASAAEACIGPGGRALSTRVTVVFAPDGSATSRVEAPFDGSAVGACITRVFDRATLPPFDGDAVTVTRVLKLGNAVPATTENFR